MRLFGIVTAIGLMTTSASAQWPARKDPSLPRGADGKVVLSAKTPRTADGKPDLSGVWALNDQSWWYDIGFSLGSEGVPLQPWAADVFRQRKDDEGKDNPSARCMPAGVPTIVTIPLPFKMIQTPGFTAVLYEYNMEYRQIFTDGRVLPGDPNPNWLGYSVGKWDGDTLVVETAGLKDNTWLDMYGHPATDALHVTERYTRRDVGNLDVEITMTDARAYTRPWRFTLHMKLQADQEPLEFVCIENNRGMEHMVGK